MEAFEIFDVMLDASVSARCDEAVLGAAQTAFLKPNSYFFYENTSQSVKGTFKKSTNEPIMKSNSRALNYFVHNATLLTSFIFP